MGGLFSSPSPAPVAPEATQPDPEEAKREARLEAIARRRRGRAGTIETSATGAFTPSQDRQEDQSASQGKTRLGQ